MQSIEAREREREREREKKNRIIRFTVFHSSIITFFLIVQRFSEHGAPNTDRL